MEWRVLAAIGSRDWLYPSGIFVTVTASGGGDGIGRAIRSKTKDVRHQPSTTKTKRDKDGGIEERRHDGISRL